MHGNVYQTFAEQTEDLMEGKNTKLYIHISQPAPERKGSQYAFKENRAFIRASNFLSSKVVLYPHKSTIQPSTKYYFHVCAGVPSCYLDMSDKPQKRVRRTFVHLLAASLEPLALSASLEPLAHRRNVARVSLYCRYYFVRCSSELAEVDPFQYSVGRSTHYSKVS